jgi:hypothetical protein
VSENEGRAHAYWVAADYLRGLADGIERPPKLEELVAKYAPPVGR